MNTTLNWIEWQFSQQHICSAHVMCVCARDIPLYRKREKKREYSEYVQGVSYTLQNSEHLSKAKHFDVHTHTHTIYMCDKIFYIQLFGFETLFLHFRLNILSIYWVFLFSFSQLISSLDLFI